MMERPSVSGPGASKASEFERTRHLSGGCLAALLAAATACSDLADADDTYGTVVMQVDGRSEVEPLPPNWACLDDDPPSNVDEPSGLPPPSSTFSFIASILDYGMISPIPAQVRGCNATDIECSIGVGEGVPGPPVVPNGPPTMRINLPAEFQGFLRVSAEGYIPNDYYVGGPIVKDVVVNQPISLISPGSFVEFANGLGQNPAVTGTMGVLAVFILDCNSDPAPGVTLRLTDRDSRPTLQMAQPWATYNRLPTPGRPTDSEGVAGFVNLPTENIAVEAVIGNRSFGERSFGIRPGRLTAGTIRPRYDEGY